MKWLFLIALFAILPSVQAITTYDIHVQGTDALINATFELYTAPGEKVNYWTTTFSLGPGVSVIAVEDSKGPITKYNLTGDRIILQTHTGGAREKEVVNILYRLPRIVDVRDAPLERMNLSLSAFDDVRPDVPDEQTFINVTADEPIISWSLPFGFVVERQPSGILLAGEGPIGFSLILGRGKNYQHFILFGQGDLAAADAAFGIVPAALGFLPEYEKIPVLVLPKKEYENRVDPWSAGQYRGGMITLKGIDNSSLSTLLHETTHAFNERALRFQRTDVTWFDEGVAKYVEFLVNKKAGEHIPELFGDPVEWREGFTIYTLPSRSDPQDLWAYYLRDRTYMNTWNPSDARTREFGYDFSELLIRDFVKRHGPEALYTVMRDLINQKAIVETPGAYNAVLLKLLDSDFKPCASPEYATFLSCIKDINTFTPPLPENVTIAGQETHITIPTIQPVTEEAWYETIVNRLTDAIARIIDWFRSLLGQKVVIQLPRE